MIPRSFLRQRRLVSLSKEFRDSCRVGPRVWALVGLALVLGILFPTFVWVALAIWLVFVFPLAIGGVTRWLLAEIVQLLATSTATSAVVRQPAPRRERVITGRVVS